MRRVIATAHDVIAHPLMQRASQATSLRREVPLTMAVDDAVVEGIADLAFDEPAG